MERNLRFLLLCVMLVTICGCKKKESDEDYLIIPESENLNPVFEAAESECSVSFYASSEWTATVKNAQQTAWLKVKPASGVAGDHKLTITAERNEGAMRMATAELRCGNDVRKIFVTQNKNEYAVEGFPCVWDFYALGFNNSTKEEAREHPSAANWKTDVANPTLSTTYGNTSAYLQVYAKDGLYEKDGMTVTLNPGIQACGLLTNDYYEFIIPVKNFSPQTEISVYGATGGKNYAAAFWILEYSSDGQNWYEAAGAQNANVGSVKTKAHFWNTQTTVDPNGKRLCYYASADDSFHFYRFCCSKLNNIADGKLHLRLRVLPYSGKFDGSAPEKGWSDIKAFHVYLAKDKPNPLMKVVAHRGGYLENGAPACSRAALKKTLGQNCCGSEGDIMWTKDGDLIVAHPDEGGKVNGLVPHNSTLSQIRDAGTLSNGESIPSFNDYLDIIMDDSLNPYGAQIWVDVKWVTQAISDNALNTALSQANAKGALGRIVLMVKNQNYYDLSWDIMNKYGVEVAWNSTIADPKLYGPYGWAQVKYSDYVVSSYWPPVTYTDAGVQVSIYNCSSNLKGYEDMYVKALPYYPVLKAIFVNHPLDLVQHLVSGGYEK